MPKKRKKNLKSSRGSTTTVMSRASLPAQLAQAPDCEAECCEDADFPMSDFRAQFARPADAVVAMREGKQ
ncbi:hypothetical protein [Streptomyces arboris]|uniref:hypothetical protein n=1 Tax=Streptomyces arboris TaxID=2600619 RepID=UPI003634DA5C